MDTPAMAPGDRAEEEAGVLEPAAPATSKATGEGGGVLVGEGDVDDVPTAGGGGEGVCEEEPPSGGDCMAVGVSVGDGDAVAVAEEDGVAEGDEP